MIEFFNQNNGAITLLFTGIVAIATVVYAVLTWKLVNETNRMRKIQSEPQIAIWLSRSDEFVGFVDMTIQNIGLGPAYCVSFKVMNDFNRGERLGMISEMSFFRKGFHFLSPGQKIQCLLTSMTEDYEAKTNSVVQMHVKYKNRVDDEYQESFSLDLSELGSLVRASKPSLGDIVQSLKGLEKAIERLPNKLTGKH